MKLQNLKLICYLLCFCSFIIFSYADKKSDYEYTDEYTNVCSELHPRNKHLVFGEADIFGGFLTGNESGNTWAVGGRGFLVFGEIISLGAEYLYSTLYIDNGSRLGLIKKNKCTKYY